MEAPESHGANRMTNANRVSDREMVDAIFDRLSNAPTGLDCTNGQVLAAAGLLICGILRTGYVDPVGEAEHFSQVLQLAVKKCHGAVARTH